MPSLAAAALTSGLIAGYWSLVSLPAVRPASSAQSRRSLIEYSVGPFLGTTQLIVSQVVTSIADSTVTSSPGSPDSGVMNP